MKRIGRFSWLVVAMLALAPVPALAQAPGAATQQGEAPGGSHLAPMPSDHGSTANEDPARARSMAFAPSTGECRESVPGGSMLAIAYAIVIVLLGLYVALVARRGVRLEASIEGLEREIQRRAQAGKSGEKAP